MKDISLFDCLLACLLAGFGLLLLCSAFGILDGLLSKGGRVYPGAVCALLSMLGVTQILTHWDKKS